MVWTSASPPLPAAPLSISLFQNGPLGRRDQKRSAFLTFMGRQGRGQFLFESRLYLMHEGGFERIKAFLLANSQCILQDDSGFHSAVSMPTTG